MGIETLEQREARGVDTGREDNAAGYRVWAMKNAHEISDEALLSLFGREAAEIKAANAALLAGEKADVSTDVSNAPTVEGVSREEQRRMYQRELMRKRRAAEKQEAA